MRTRLLVFVAVVSSAVLCIGPLIAARANEQDEDTLYDPLLAAMHINYAAVTLCRIEANDDVVVLQEEYDNIINNIDIAKIQDKQAVDLYARLMDSLTVAQINQKQRELARRRYAMQVDSVVRETLMESLREFQVAEYKALGRLAALQALKDAGMFYFNYQANLAKYRLERDESDWSMQATMRTELNEIRKAFFSTYWELARSYGFRPEWRLTKEKIAEYLDTLTDEDEGRKYRKLDSMKGSFEAYPPFWCEFGKAAQALGMEPDAMAHYEKFLALRKGVCEKDPYLVAVRENMIQLVTKPGAESVEEDEIRAWLGEIIANSHARDWENRLFAALAYASLSTPDFTRAEKLLQRNIDGGYSVALHALILGDIALSKGDDEQFCSLVEAMFENPDCRWTDAISLYAKKPQEKLAPSVSHAMGRFSLHIAEGLWGSDDVVVEVPALCWNEDMQPRLRCAAQIHDQDVEANEDAIETAIEHTADTADSAAESEFVNCVFEGVFDLTSFKDSHGNGDKTFFTFVLDDGHSEIEVVFELAVVEQEKERNSVSRWVRERLDEEEAGKYIEKTVTSKHVSFTLNGEEFRIEDGLPTQHPPTAVPLE